MGQLGLHRLMTTLSWDFQVPELLAAYKRAADKRPRIAGDRRPPGWPRRGGGTTKELLVSQSGKRTRASEVRGGGAPAGTLAGPARRAAPGQGSDLASQGSDLASQGSDLAGQEPARPGRQRLATSMTFISLVVREWMRRRPWSAAHRGSLLQIRQAGPRKR